MRGYLAALAFAAVAATGGPVAAQSADAPTLDDVLARAGAYVVSFERLFSSLVAEEHYTQWLDSGTSGLGRFGQGSRSRRVLKSDFLLVRSDETQDWVPFRDVFEVDGTAVREREDRLMKLFMNAPRDAFRQAQRISSESARYNIGPLTRTVNVPTLPLKFLDPVNLGRSDFTKTDEDRLDDVPVWEIAFEEISIPTLIRTNNERSLLAEGRFWIDPRDGTVFRARLELDVENLRSEITVDYVAADGVDVRVPGELKERYEGPGFRLEGTATYGHLRRFQVITDEVIGDER